MCAHRTKRKNEFGIKIITYIATPPLHPIRNKPPTNLSQFDSSGYNRKA